MSTEYKDIYIKYAAVQIWKTRKYSYKNISRPDFGLLYLISGKITYRFADEEIVLSAGDLIFLPKNSNYEVEFDINGCEVKNYLLNFDSFSGNMFFSFDIPTVVLKDNGKTIINDLAELVSCFNRGEHPLLKQALFYKCVFNIFSTYSNFKDKELLTFTEIARLFENDFNVSIDDVCKRFNLSRSVIQKKFNFYYGVTPSEYRNKKRIQKAKLLLETTDIPIKEISEMMGFYDTAYFYKVFKKATGFTPLEYSKSVTVKL